MNTIFNRVFSIVRGSLPRLQLVSIESLPIIGGAVCMLVYVNLTSSGAVSVISQAEAEGPRFASTDQLDIDTTFTRKRVCQAFTQRWVWRWIMVNGKREQQAFPLTATVAPFLADTDSLVVSIPNPGVPDLWDNWFYRSVTAENCPMIPETLAAAAGGAGTMTRSKDVPVSFTGDPPKASGLISGSLPPGTDKPITH